MSWEATSAVIKKSTQKGSARLMMLVIGNYADKFGFAWPGITTIALDTKLSPRNIQYLEAKAIASGELEVFPNEGPAIRTGRSKGQRTNLFRITLCEPPTPDHPYFGIKRWCKDFTTSAPEGGESQRRKVVQETASGGERQRRKVVQGVAPDPSGSVSEPSKDPKERTVDKSTSSRSGTGIRECTHLKCGPEGCGYPGGSADKGMEQRPDLTKPDWKGPVDKVVSA
jgi:hypothetical protein